MMNLQTLHLPDLSVNSPYHPNPPCCAEVEKQTYFAHVFLRRSVGQKFASAFSDHFRNLRKSIANFRKIRTNFKKLGHLGQIIKKLGIVGKLGQLRPLL